MEDLI